MTGRARSIVAAGLALVSALLTPASAEGASDVFGTVGCLPREGLSFCEGSVAARVPSFDGVPLDVNVTLPDTGGRFPLVVLLHGWGGEKGSFSDSKRWAEAGYAVLTYTARGFHESCGTPSSRSHPGCARGWIHLADSRYEVRDTQHLAGLLVDEGHVDGERIGVTGRSYGGGQSLQLATLRDRIRRPDGSYAAWRSPGGQPMRIAAAAPVIGWSDLAYALLPNGRTRDYSVTGAEDDLSPIGVKKESYVNSLFSIGNASGYYAPPGADPDADLGTWFELINAGEPYDDDPVLRDAVRELATNHSAYYLDHSQAPAPLLMVSGWTDDLFPVNEALRYANRVTSEYPAAVVAQLYLDYGHRRAQNKAADNERVTETIRAFFDRYVKGQSRPVLSGVEALTQTCGAEAASGGPLRARSWSELHPGEVRVVDRTTKDVLSGSGDDQIGNAADPMRAGHACVTTGPTFQPGTATYALPPAAADGYTMLGSPTVIADISVQGQNAALAARLWDLAPDGSSQTLVARGVYRPDTSGWQVFQLFPNGWHFAPGHIAKLELVGKDASFLRPPNGSFTVRVGRLDLRLPTYDRPDGRQVTVPQPLPGMPTQHQFFGFPAPPAARKSRADRCLPRTLRIRRSGIGAIHLRQTHRRLMRDLGRPTSRRGRRLYRYCVRGGGRVVAVFGTNNRVRLAATNAPGHRTRGVGPGSRTRRIRLAYRYSRRLRRGLHLAGRTSRVLFVVRDGRVRSVAVAERSLIRRPSRVMSDLRRARLR